MNTIIIFIKNPILGKVKTRLAATIGNEKALEVYKSLLSFTQQLTMKIDAKRIVFYSDYLDENDDWSVTFFQKNVQQGNDLGQRMSNAFEYTLKTSEKVIIIGSDCAELTPDILQQTFEILDNNDFVIGPARDGGYYLLGMKNFEPAVFENIEWSTSEVFSKTIDIIENKQKTVRFLPILNDLDNEQDWNAVKHLLS